MKILVLFLITVFGFAEFALSATAASTSAFGKSVTVDDPYNALVWNRHNLNRGENSVDRGDWYEWWYFKLIDQKTGTPFYFVYGATNPWDITGQNKNSRSFVSFGHFGEGWTVEKDFPIAEFKATYEKMNVEISTAGGATAATAWGDLSANDANGKAHHVKWNLQSEMDWSFKAMGWTMGLDWSSSIYWYPAQASLIMNGLIEVDGRTYKIENAQGYQDRNWGRIFPKWWSWIVSNNFKNSPTTRLAGGGGLPKVVNALEMPIFVLGLRHEGSEFSFRLNDGDQVNMDISFGKWHVDAKNKKGYRVIVDGEAAREKFMDLVFRTPQGLLFHDWEALQGNLRVQLFKLSGLKWKKIADLESDQAGLEFGSFEKNPTGKFSITSGPLLFSPIF